MKNGFCTTDLNLAKQKQKYMYAKKQNETKKNKNISVLNELNQSSSRSVLAEMNY